MKINKTTFLGFLFCSCFFYTSQIMLSPVYFGFILIISISFLYIFIVDDIYVDFNFIFGVLGLVYCIIIFFSVLDFGTYINFIMCMLLLVFYSAIFKHVKLQDSKVILFFTVLLFLLYISECAYRLNNPILTSKMIENADETLLFYQYKFNSIMFIDSNFVALSLISFVASIDVLYSKGKLKFIFILLSLLLILLTFSRAAIISIIIYLFLKNANLKFKLVILLIVSIFAFSLLPIILNDGSYLSKLKIINLFHKYISNIDFIDFLLGSGIGSSAHVLGIGSHNLFVLLIVEYGFISFFGFTLFVLFNIYQTSFKSFPYWSSILICGFSLGSIYLFIFLPALLLTNKYRRQYYEK